MLLVKGGQIVQDEWTRVEDDASLPEGPTLISAARLLAGDVAHKHLGVIWPNDKPVSELAPYLPKLALVALVFPTFRDGRAYTQARQLREQHGFTGELRATGHVLRDQFLFMARAGFTAFEVTKPADAEAFAKALNEFSVFYQPAADTRMTAWQKRLAHVPKKLSDFLDKEHGKG